MDKETLLLVISKMVAIEEAMLDLRKVIATGSMLQGWTPREPKDVDQARVQALFAKAGDASIRVTYELRNAG